MKKIFLIISLVCAGLIQAQTDTITITSLMYRASDTSVLVAFDTFGSWSGTLTNYEYSFNGGTTWTTLSPSSTSVDSIRIPDANGYSSVKIRAIIISPADTVISNTFTVGNPLPVTWLTVDAGHTENGNLVTWTTGSEKNNDYFLVETSLDAIIWNVISSKIEPRDTTGNKASLSEYDWLHPGNTSKLYYRIKQVDFDGKYEFSKVVYANKNTKDNSSISASASTESTYFYPNPTSDKLYIVGYANTVTVITDNIGRIVFHKTLDSGQEVLDIKNLSPGTYNVQMADRDRKISVKKLIIE